MGGSGSKDAPRGDPVPPHGLRCLGLTLDICDLLDVTATKKGKLTADALRPRVERIRALVALWGHIDSEFNQLAGEDVLRVAAAVSLFEDKLYRCLQRANKLKKSTLMPQWKLSANVDHILQDVEDAHVVFRGTLLHTLGQDFPAPALPSGPIATAPLPRMNLTAEPSSPTIGALHNPPYDSLKQAAERGDLNAAATLGDMHRRGTPPAAQDLALALQYLTQAADGGHMAAAHSLGTMAESGEGITGGADLGAAAAWYQVAAEGGHASGMADYAYFVEHGHGVSQDQDAARGWYEAAATAGSVRAQNNLGMMMFEGRGGPVNASMAAAWFRLAAANGSMAAASNLGICYEDGVGVPADLDMAKDCYKQAASSGHVRARTNLGYLACRRQHLSKAMSHFQVAADAGDEDAMYCLASLKQGKNPLDSSAAGGRTGGTLPAPMPVSSDAEQLFWRSAEKGDARAQYWAAAQLQGQGSAAEAQRYLRLAADQGHQDAMSALNRTSPARAPRMSRLLSRDERRGTGGSPYRASQSWRAPGGVQWQLASSKASRLVPEQEDLMSTPKRQTLKGRAQSPAASYVPNTRSRNGQGPFSASKPMAQGSSQEFMQGADAELNLNANLVQVHSDAIQAGLETIKKLLDGRISPAGDDDEDDDEFFENLANDDLELDDVYSHRAIAA